VARYRQWLIEERGVDEDTLGSIDEQVAAEVAAAVAAAAAAPVPPDEELQTDVFADSAALPS
jgi:TPP-dependent pyruvate/acetoin dehydrogenase alpha subunit